MINELWNSIIKHGANTSMTEVEFLAKEWQSFQASEKRKAMVNGHNYYRGKQDIQNKRRMAIGTEGRMEEISYLPNNKLCYNQYANLVDQKTNYLFAKPFEVILDDESKADIIDDIIDDEFRRIVKRLAMDTYNAGVGYLHPYIDNEGLLRFRRFNPSEILPFYKDDQEREIESFLRVYNVESYEGTQKSIVQYAEYYEKDGVSFYKLENNKFIPTKEKESYVTLNGAFYAWERIPLIPFRCNSEAIALITRVKSLQDALNTLASNFADNMAEDIRNTIFVIKNYDGQNLDEFRHNLSAYGAVKVRTFDGVAGDVSTLTVNVNAGNYESVIRLLKRAIIEVGHGFDAKDDRMSNNPNQMNIRSIYSDIDLDANDMETEFRASFKQLFWFVESYLSLKGVHVDLSGTKFMFNRDTPINEGEVIANCANSMGVLSHETIIKNHPWTQDTAEELKRIKEDQAEALKQSMVMDYLANGGDNGEG